MFKRVIKYLCKNLILREGVVKMTTTVICAILAVAAIIALLVALLAAKFNSKKDASQSMNQSGADFDAVSTGFEKFEPEKYNSLYFLTDVEVYDDGGFTFSYNGVTYNFVFDDIATIKADAIAYGANNSLSRGSGSAESVPAAVGPAWDDLVLDKRCKTGDAVITGSGNMRDHGVKHVIHAVGPNAHRGVGRGQGGQLHSAYLRMFQLAEEKGAKSLATCSISAGIYGYPSRTQNGEPGYPECFLAAAMDFAHGHSDGPLKTITMVIHKEDTKSTEQMRAFRDFITAALSKVKRIEPVLEV
jgi:O-acetyl-ADP-ribose deacetylase (regulator of RNase III)